MEKTILALRVSLKNFKTGAFSAIFRFIILCKMPTFHMALSFTKVRENSEIILEFYSHIAETVVKETKDGKYY